MKNKKVGGPPPRIPYGTRLAPDVIEVLRSQPVASRFIEKLVRDYVKQHPPQQI